MLTRPSGGLFYHLRALRHGRAWQPFRQQIESWLNSWNPHPKELLLIGPSAGYTLPTDWLRQFNKITAYDLDPLAPLIFRWRHPGLNISFKRKDMFWRDGQLSLSPMREELASHPLAATLFVNVLGQVLLEGQATEEAWQSYLGNLRQELNARVWATYHDRYSTSGFETIDHLTGGPWSTGLRKHDFTWQLTAKTAHQIEGLQAP